MYQKTRQFKCDEHGFFKTTKYSQLGLTLVGKTSTVISKCPICYEWCNTHTEDWAESFILEILPSLNNDTRTGE